MEDAINNSIDFIFHINASNSGIDIANIFLNTEKDKKNKLNLPINCNSIAKDCFKFLQTTVNSNKEYPKNSLGFSNQVVFDEAKKVIPKILVLSSKSFSEELYDWKKKYICLVEKKDVTKITVEFENELKFLSSLEQFDFELMVKIFQDLHDDKKDVAYSIVVQDGDYAGAVAISNKKGEVKVTFSGISENIQNILINMITDEKNCSDFIVRFLAMNYNFTDINNRLPKTMLGSDILSFYTFMATNFLSEIKRVDKLEDKLGKNKQEHKDLLLENQKLKDRAADCEQLYDKKKLEVINVASGAFKVSLAAQLNKGLEAEITGLKKELRELKEKNSRTNDGSQGNNDNQSLLSIFEQLGKGYPIFVSSVGGITFLGVLVCMYAILETIKLFV
ncbi:MAG TPA: hypothetical protein VLB80_03485 [Candidatus Babeliales bacterium]|nr:hypothetical protein [Candidatus Babeliales bacterium]